MMALAATPARSELPQPGAEGSDEDKSGTALAWFSFLSIVITPRGGQAPGQGRWIEDTVPHDKIKAASRERTAKTGEPYTAARRAVVTEHQGSQAPPPGAGYPLRMSGEIHDWLADLRGSDPRAAMRVVQALAALMEDGADLGDPLVVSTAGSWPWVLTQALDRSYQESLERVRGARRAEADAATLLKDIHEQAAQYQADEMRRLLPTATEARNRLDRATQRLQARADAFRTRKEVLKAAYIAAQGSLKAHQAIAALDQTGKQQDTREAIRAAEAALAGAIGQMERELGQDAWPQGLMELRPGAPVHSDIRVLFAVEPPGTALLIAVLEGPDVVEDQFSEAVMASADMLRLVRAGQAPDAAAHGYENSRSFLDEFCRP